MYIFSISTGRFGHWRTSLLRLIGGEAVGGTEDGRFTDGRCADERFTDGRHAFGIADGHYVDGRPVGLTGAAVKKSSICGKQSATVSEAAIRNTAGVPSVRPGAKRTRRPSTVSCYFIYGRGADGRTAFGIADGHYVDGRPEGLTGAAVKKSSTCGKRSATVSEAAIRNNAGVPFVRPGAKRTGRPSTV